ncbi:MAG: DUF4440 domain-containing protein [Chlorobi bacterium]|nr:DUF4440 domain-containing protein [Chlorobiota bacterium]
MTVSANSLSQTDLQKEKETLKQVDIDFSNQSKEKGMREAFLAYAADNAVLLRPHSYPIEGLEEIKKFLGDENPPFTLTWTPEFADVSVSGELGYTYGIYELTDKDENGNEIAHKGTYLSVWKKDKKGNWKWILDTGNPGLEPKN